MTTFSGYFAQATFNTASGITLKSMSADFSVVATAGGNGHALYFFMALIDPSNNFFQVGSVTGQGETSWHNFSTWISADGSHRSSAQSTSTNSSGTLSLTHSDINHNWVGTVIGDTGSEVDVSDSNFGGSGIWKVYAVLEARGTMNSNDQVDFISGILGLSSISILKSDGSALSLTSPGWTVQNSGTLAGSAFADWCDISEFENGTTFDFSCNT